jgi:mono/diheme cytochrome c family protein
MMAAVLSAGCGRRANKDHLGPSAWTSAEWRKQCLGVRTSYNATADLTDETLTLVPGDPRWLDFVYWSIDNKVAEHQVEAYGGTGWEGPKGGVIFHWAPGSHWERDTLASFGFTIGHTVGEHRWTDTMFPDFFEKYGGTYGVNVKDRLVEIDPGSPTPWVAFLEYAGGATSPYYRYLFHREAEIDPAQRAIHLIGGQGVAFTYSFERYYHELREVLTDCRAVDFFQMYDRLGSGFASEGNWARQNPPRSALEHAGYGQAGAAGVRYDPSPPAVDVPPDLQEADRMRRGKEVYLAQCAVCHGVQGDGAGVLAKGFDVRPRDFHGGTYKFRSTIDLPTFGDIERTVRLGVPGTPMPAWGQFLTAPQIGDVARYVTVFSPRFVKALRDRAEPKAVAMSVRPADLAPLAARGGELYKSLDCSKCHGEQGRGDGPSAQGMKDDWGQPIRPTDLTYKWSFHNGHEPEDVYRTILAGLNGTPMPAYTTAIGPEADRWAIVAYVLSLSPAARPALHLADFAGQRRARIGRDGHVVATDRKAP